jgi:hypothetical protein
MNVVSLKQHKDDEFLFFNSGRRQRLFMTYEKQYFTQFMMKYLIVKEGTDLRNFESIRVCFVNLLWVVEYQFSFKELTPDKTKKGRFYFEPDKEFVVLDIPEDADVAGIELLGSNLKKEQFEIYLPHFLV